MQIRPVFQGTSNTNTALFLIFIVSLANTTAIPDAAATTTTTSKSYRS